MELSHTNHVSVHSTLSDSNKEKEHVTIIDDVVNDKTTYQSPKQPLDATDIVAESLPSSESPLPHPPSVPHSSNPFSPQSISSLTPLKWKMFAQLLKPHPDQAMVAQLIHDLQHGVRIGYNGPRDSFRPSPNLPILLEHESFVDEEIAKEVNAGRRIGPFDSPPFPNLIVSPIGVVTKKFSTKLRMIHHLSWPTQQHATTDSINEHISEEDSKTVLQSFDDAVSMLANIPKSHSKPILLCKIDIKSAYRLVPVHPEDWHCLGMHWKGKYYFDPVLVFGLASACLQWERVATAAHWIAKHHLGLNLLVHYIDDYLLISIGSQLAEWQLKALLKLFDMLGLPISVDKLEGPSQKMLFLGIEISTCDMTVSIDHVRMQYVQSILTNWMNKSHSTLHELQSLIGTLSFCCKVIRVGRVFLRRLINLSAHWNHRHGNIRVRAHASHPLPDSVKKDIQWWSTYMTQFNGTLSIYPIVWCEDKDMFIATDACQYGYGAVFGKHWFYGVWSADEEQQSHRHDRDSMPWKELHCLVRAASTWGKHWKGKNIVFRLDCQPMVFAVSKGGSKDPEIMSLLRTLSYIAATFEFCYKVNHIAGHTNIGPDHLSRGHVSLFQSLFPDSNPLPCQVLPIPCHTW